MRKITFLLLIYILLHITQVLHANGMPLCPPYLQGCANDIFLPVVHNYLPQQYKGANQNWSITQSDEGIIYIANNHRDTFEMKIKSN